MIDPVLGALGLGKGATVGGFLGALVSLKFIEGLRIWQGITTLFCGTVAAAKVTPLALPLLKLTTDQDGAISFLIGVFGMAIGAAFVKALPDLFAAIKDRVKGGP